MDAPGQIVKRDLDQMLVGRRRVDHGHSVRVLQKNTGLGKGGGGDIHKFFSAKSVK